MRPNAFAVELLSVERRRFFRALHEHRGEPQESAQKRGKYLSSIAVSDLTQTVERLKEGNDEI